MSISERVFALLSEQGKTQTALANYIGVRIATVSSWKVRHIDPSADLLEKIACFFDVSIDYLCTGNEKYDAPLLSDNHVALLVCIKKAGYANAAALPRNLLGDHNEYADTYAAIEYLLKCDFIEGVADVDVPKDKQSGHPTYRLTERGVAYIDRHVGGGSGNLYQGVFGDGNHHNAVNIGGAAGTLSEFEQELLRVYAALDARGKNALLSFAYDLEKKIEDK